MSGTQRLDWYRSALADMREQRALPFVIRLGDELVGTTRFADFMNTLPACEIGWTWLDRGQHGSGLNTSIKYLMLVFNPLPCWPRSSQVQPISQAGRVFMKSAKRVVPTNSSPRRMTNGSARCSRISARALRYQSSRWVPLMYSSSSRLASASATSAGISASESGSRRRAPRCKVTSCGLNIELPQGPSLGRIANAPSYQPLRCCTIESRRKARLLGCDLGRSRQRPALCNTDQHRPRLGGQAHFVSLCVSESACRCRLG